MAHRAPDERYEPSLALAAPGGAPADGPYPTETLSDRPLAWGAGLSVAAHVAVLAAAIVLVSRTPQIDLPDPIPIEIVYASQASPAPSAPERAAAPKPTPKPAPQAPPVAAKSPPPKPVSAPKAPKEPSPSGIALPEKAEAPHAIPPPPPTRPKFVPPPRHETPPQPTPRVANLPSPRAPAPTKPAAPARAAPTPRAPSPASSGAAARRTTPPVYAEAALGNRPPIYPPIARQNGWEGHVLLRAHILADGSLDTLKIAQSSGFDILDQAALDAVRRWRFRPARKDGEAVPSELDLGFTFRLTDDR